MLPQCRQACTLSRRFTRAFQTTSQCRSAHELPDYYATLEIEAGAKPAEIKKQFYKLSKANHPDLNPDNASASQRFVKISEAYAVLGSNEKRAKYDRDFLRAQPHGHPRSRTRPQGSYSSASAPAGGRPASGLSRRRSQFRGPPPSFYRSGGWGVHSEKREEHARRASHSHEARGQAQSGPAGPAGTGPGGFTSGFDNDVPHFNQQGHFRTHNDIERARQQTRRKTTTRVTSDDYESSSSQLFNFILVSGILVGAIAIAASIKSLTEPAKPSNKTKDD